MYLPKVVAARHKRIVAGNSLAIVVVKSVQPARNYSSMDTRTLYNNRQIRAHLYYL